jgi:hypothetical protein
MRRMNPESKESLSDKLNVGMAFTVSPFLYCITFPLSCLPHTTMESGSKNGRRKEIRVNLPAPHAKQQLTRPYRFKLSI